jgi:branched-chain amino acid transport system permease protein
MPADLFAQALNGLAYGVLLFLLSVGLTLIFGMLDVVNLTHAPTTCWAPTRG